MIWPLYASTLTKLNLVLFRSKVCPVLLIYENGYKEYLELRRYLHVYTALHVYRPSLILYAFDVDWGPLTPPLKALEEHCQNGNRAFGSARKFMVRGVFDRSYYRPILLVSPVQLYAIVLHGDGRQSVRKNTRALGTLHLVNAGTQMLVDRASVLKFSI